jgi:hypothetical protein
VLSGLEIPEAQVESMADRDFVRVSYLAEADEQEGSFQRALGLVRYGD